MQPPGCSVKKGVLRDFTNIIGKHLCRSLFFNKASGLRPATKFKKRLQHRCFPMNFVKSFKNTFFTKHFQATASSKSEFLPF